MSAWMAPALSSPKVATVQVTSIEEPYFRLDAKYYQEEFRLALSRVYGCGLPYAPLSELATAFVPTRIKLFTSPSSKAGAPYLRAHDAFEVRPHSKRYTVRSRTEDYDQFLLKEGMLLTPSSGRNLGPIAYAGKKLSQFAMTDILRIVPKSGDIGFYLLAYLLTPTGQALIRRGRTGTNVDHLSPSDVMQIPVAELAKKDRQEIIGAIRLAEERLDRARLTLDNLEHELHALAGLKMGSSASGLEKSGAKAFSVNSGTLTLRLDAAYYDPAVRSAWSAIKRSGGKRLDEMAELRLLGRYKRYYVPKDFGRPILSGRHLLQLRPVNLQFISDRSFRSPDDYVIQHGWCLFTCDGRAEEQLGSPAFVHRGWDGWMASNHIMRAVPRDGVQPGYLYLALRSPYVQLQLKARATGSVIDALEPQTIGEVLLPCLPDSEQRRLGEAAVSAWDDIAAARSIEDEVIAKFENFIVDGYERSGQRSGAR